MSYYAQHIILHVIIEISFGFLKMYVTKLLYLVILKYLKACYYTLF